MSASVHLKLTSLLVLVVLLTRVVLTVPVLADDGAPPPPDAAPAADSAPDAGDAMTMSPTGEVDIAGESVGEDLPQLPEGTQVVVLDDRGDALPLASAEAAEVVSTADPVWCPTGVAPQNGLGGCTVSYSTLYALTNDIATNVITEPGANGVIWIQSGVDFSATPIVIDGSDPDLGTWSNFSLTLKGGWNGTFGSTLTSPLTPSFFSTNISVINWNNAVTISDVAISTTPAGTNALEVVTSGNIQLDRVNIHDNTVSGNGATLDNTSGTASVVVNSSQFNNNAQHGLVVNSNGTITLTSITADSNQLGRGLNLSDTGVGKSVTINGPSEFNNNHTDGLYILSAGAITLKDISANDNGFASGNGAYLDNTASSNAAVTLTGSSFFTDNFDIGLQVSSHGTIKINNVSANSNGGQGSYLGNNGAIGTPAVTLTGGSEFKFNGSDGLSVNSKGLVALSNIKANSNTGKGLNIDNTAGSSVGVTLTGTSSFLNNQSDGIYVRSKGTITLANITANENGIAGGTDGADLSNTSASGFMAVTLSGTNTFKGNYSTGLTIYSKGVITLNNVTADGNLNDVGAYLSNTASTPATPKALNITGTNSFSGNYSFGLTAYSYGAMTLNSIKANENGILASSGGGAYLDNASLTVTPAAVTLNGTNAFDKNYNDGLDIISKGAIKVTSVTASGNGVAVGAGISLQNYGPGAVGGVTISGTNAFEGNYSVGLQVQSQGTITLSNISANDSLGSDGVFLDNTYSTTATPKAITISGTNSFSDNSLHGLEAYSYGAMTLNNITANGNGFLSFSGDGVYLVNNGAITPAAVTLNGANNFNDNHDDGLHVISIGAIKVNNATAGGNGLTALLGTGLHLDNSGVGALHGGVTVSGTNLLSGNHLEGLWVHSTGAVTLAKITASSSVGGSGVTVDNTYSTSAAPQNVTLSGTNTISSNHFSGLVVNTYATVSISSLSANGNGLSGSGYGASIDNGTSTITPKTVTLSGTNIFDGNKDTGLYIRSHGTISVNNVSAINSISGSGAILSNNTGVPSSAVKVTGVNSFSDNFSIGLDIATLGAVSLTSLTVSSNGSFGAAVANDYPGAVGPVTLSGTNVFEDNYYDGLRVLSSGAVTLKNVTASDNGLVPLSGYGAFIVNSSGTLKSVALTGTNVFNHDYDSGLWIYTQGAISSATSLTANDTVGGAGIQLSNIASTPATPQKITLSGSTTVKNNYYTGLSATSYGAISASNVTADGNNTAGVVSDGVFLVNDSATTPAGVTLTGTNAISNNKKDGLVINTDGNISISNLTASNNGLVGSPGIGAWLDNHGAGGIGSVTLTGTNVFQGDYLSGLRVESNGAIAVSSVTASDSVASDGADLLNTSSGPSSPQNVTLTGVSSFIGNYWDGLYIVTYGTVTASNLTANSNGVSGSSGKGVEISNQTGTTAKNVTLTGTNSFIGNYSTGLYITSLGSISASNLTAEDGTSGAAIGAVLYNNYGSSTGTVTVSGVNQFNNNGSTGLSIFSFGTVTLASITASDNGGSAAGVFVDNHASLAPQNITMTGTNFFNGNGSDGLDLGSKGTITLSNVTANDNGGNGVHLDNDEVGASGGVTMTGVNTFVNNAVDGLQVYSQGVVSLSKITADGNISNGMSAITTGNLTLTCGSFTNNGGYGWLAIGMPTLTLIGVVASGNTTGESFTSGIGTVVTVRNCP